jgi:hypothetical protein
VRWQIGSAIRRLTAALEADEDELLILAKKVPPAMLDRLMAQLTRLERKAN